MAWNATPEQKARYEARERAARRMRAEGKSYEQIAEELSGPDAFAPLGDVYHWANPDKTPAQTRAWKSKHVVFNAAEDARFDEWAARYRPTLGDYDDAA
jgi:hypothetical protein